MLKVTKKLFNLLNYQEKKNIVGLVIMMIIGALLESLSISFVVPLVSAIMNDHTWNTSIFGHLFTNLFHISNTNNFIRFILYALIFLFIFKNLYILIQNYHQQDLTSKIRLRIQNELLHHYALQPYTYYLDVEPATITRNVRNDTASLFSIISNCLTFYTEIIICLLMIVVVFIIDVKITSIMAITILLEYFIVIKLIKPLMRKQGQLNREAQSESSRWILQLVKGIKSVKVSESEAYFEDKHGAQANVLITTEKKQKVLAVAPKLLIESLTVSVLMLYILYLLNTGKQLQMIVPILSAFVVAAVKVLPCVNHISSSVSTISYHEAALNNIIETYQNINKTHTNKSNVEPLPFKEKISLNNVTYKYPQGERNILTNVNLDIIPGESIGFIGPSGAGKTTTIDLILGLLDPNIGTITVDNINIQDNLKRWLKTVAYIPQDVFILNGTIKENVAFGIDEQDVDENKVWDALEKAQLKDYILTLNEGIHTNLKESGIRFSGGQKQRIGIARALYNNPEVLIFDEATSSLDNETETMVMESIQSLKGIKTMLIIAHRLSTIENCDHIYKVENETIIKEK